MVQDVINYRNWKLQRIWPKGCATEFVRCPFHIQEIFWKLLTVHGVRTTTSSMVLLGVSYFKQVRGTVHMYGTTARLQQRASELDYLCVAGKVSLRLLEHLNHLCNPSNFRVESCQRKDGQIWSMQLWTRLKEILRKTPQLNS